MKETISVNLASQAFTFDKDAYRRLKEYLDAIRRRLPAGDPEILNDVEARLAESGPGLYGERFAYFRYADRTRS